MSQVTIPGLGTFNVPSAPSLPGGTSAPITGINGAVTFGNILDSSSANSTSGGNTAFTGGVGLAADLGIFGIAVIAFLLVNSFLTFKESAALAFLLILAAFAGNGQNGNSVLKTLNLP